MAAKKAKNVSAKPKKGNDGKNYSPVTKKPYPSNVDKGWERVVYDVSGTVAKVPFDVARGVEKLGEGLVRGVRGAVYQTVGRPTNAKPTLGVPNPNAKSTARRKSGGGSASRKK